jgi:transcription elongation GreA/GreB family factor
VNKPALFDAFKRHLEGLLETVEHTQQSAVAATRVDGDHRPANRGERGAVTSQAYLAQGLGARAAELREFLALLKLIPPTPRERLANGAVATLLDEEDKETLILVLPGGQGHQLETEGKTITVLSTKAPLLKNLLGKQSGESGRVTRGNHTQEVEIVELL